MRRRPECLHEGDVLDALQTSAWPDCCGEDLRRHVRGCPSCAELVDIVLPLIGDARAAALGAAVPSSAVMWWRLQMRARREATARAMRPIAAFQGLALACAAGLLVAAVDVVSPAFRAFASWVTSLGTEAVAAGTTSRAWADLQLFSPLGLTIALVAALFVVVTPVAIYLAVSDR